MNIKCSENENRQCRSTGIPDFNGKLEPFIRPAWWTPKIDAHLSSIKDEAKKLHESLCKLPDIGIIYKDVSGIENKVGAATYHLELTSQLGKPSTV